MGLRFILQLKSLSFFHLLLYFSSQIVVLCIYAAAFISHECYLLVNSIAFFMRLLSLRDHLFYILYHLAEVGCCFEFCCNMIILLLLRVIFFAHTRMRRTAL